MSDKIFIECECGAHILQVEFDNEISGDPCFYLAMFEYGRIKESWRRRLSLIWKIIKTGEGHKDQLILSKEESEKLAAFLTEKNNQK